MERLYLDHNATSPPWPETLTALADAFAGPHGNAASQHAFGRKVRRLLEAARDELIACFGGETSAHRSDRLIFTSGATEANNLAIFGLAGDRPGRLVTSPYEHPSVREPLDELGRRGWEVVRLRGDPSGRIDPAELDAILAAGDCRLVSLQTANHETGILQPLAEAAAVALARGVPFHTDATQAAGKLPLNFRELRLTALSFSGHKLQGPLGIGGLLLSAEATLRPLLVGGFQQGGLRAGTEPTPLVLGLAAAVRKWHAERDLHAEHLRTLRDGFEARLKAAVPGLTIHGEHSPRLPQTSNVAFPGVDRQPLLAALDLAGVACSTGSACASGSNEPSPVLSAMGLSPAALRGALRFSFGPLTSPADAALAAARVLECVARLSGR